MYIQEDTVKYLEDIPTLSVYLCLKESAGCKKEEEGLPLLASDSTGIEKDRYDYEVLQVKKNKKFEPIRIKLYLKWHVIDVLPYLIILI
jgi:hypothetical protein